MTCEKNGVKVSNCHANNEYISKGTPIEHMRADLADENKDLIRLKNTRGIIHAARSPANEWES